MNNTAYLFDVDGVLTDPKEKKMTEQELPVQILNLLEKGNPVCLNTGRSAIWLEERIITKLLKLTDSEQLYKNFIAIAEKGGTWVTLEENNALKHNRREELTVSADLQEEVKHLVNTKYHESMFFDDTKETMISIEMHDGYAIPEFQEQQKLLVNDLKQLLHRSKLENKYKIDPTTIATDIESPQAGKALGAVRFLEFLKEKNIHPDTFIAFGDSISDFEMADELYRRDKQVELIYVGDIEKIIHIKKNYPVIKVGSFTKGTLKYLTS